MSAKHAAIRQKTFVSGTTPIISNEEMDDKFKIVKSLEQSGLLIKEVSETIEKDIEQKSGFLGT